MKTAALIGLLLAADPKGAYVARKVTVDVPDAGTVTVGDGGITGCWLDTGTCIERARERFELQERVRLAESNDLKHHESDALSITMSLVAGFIIGTTLGVAFEGLLRPTQPSP